MAEAAVLTQLVPVAGALAGHSAEKACRQRSPIEERLRDANTCSGLSGPRLADGLRAKR